jgi:hypothetical protein
VKVKTFIKNCALFAGVMAILFMAVGCSKHPDDTILGPNVPADTTAAEYHCGVNVVDTLGIGVDGVAIYIVEGVPAVRHPWPAANRNLTHDGGIIEPNDIAPGDYAFIGVKEGYEVSSPCFIHIPANPPYVVYLVLHQRPVTPPPPTVVYRMDVQTNVSDPTVKYDGQLWNLGVSQISAGHHTVEVSKDGYVSKSVEFEAVGNETVPVVVNLDPVAPSPSAPYIAENLYRDAGLNADVFVLKTNVAGECAEQITYIVLDGSNGPMLAIQLFTGKVYKFNPDNTASYAGYDVMVIHKDDEFRLNLGQTHIKDYPYSRATYIYGPNIVASQWHYDGRYSYPEPTLLSTRIVDEDAGQWDKLNR